MFVGLLQEVFAFGCIDLPCVAVFDECGRRGVEGHAYIHRGITSRAVVEGLVTTVAHAYSYVRGRFYNVCRPFVVQYVEGVFIRYLRFLSEDPPHLGIASADKLLHEIFLHGDVLFEKFAESLLVNILPDPHEGELKETGHGRRNCVYLLSFLLNVDQYCPFRKLIQHFLRLVFGHIPNICSLFRPERLYRKLCHQTGLFFGHQYL